MSRQRIDYSPPERAPGDYLQMAVQYACDVVNGDIPACQYVIWACQRQLEDLAKAHAGDFDYTFDPDRAEDICFFAERCRHIKGKWRGSRIKLEPWQVFILTTLFGWVDEEGDRRFRDCYIEVPRKNAKSTLTAVIGLYMLAADMEGGAECYSAATTKDQAKIVWTVAKKMAELSPDLAREYGISTAAHSIYVEATESFFKAVSREGENQDGYNVHFSAIDEYHAHKSRAVVEVLDTGMGSRTQPLMLKITTAGNDIASVCYEDRGYCLQVLNPDLDEIEDDNVFAIVYSVDVGDEDQIDGDLDHWDEEAIWRKANPNFGVSVLPFDMRRLAKKAKQLPVNRSAFLTKRLNVWVGAGVAWMDMLKWKACQTATLDLSALGGQQCWMGYDLASKLDLVSQCKLFVVDGVWKWFWRFYLPEQAVKESKHAMIKPWVDQGFIKATPGNVIDFDTIEEDLEADCSQFEVKAIGYDPHQATQFASRALNEGRPMVEVRPTYLNFSEPMKELQKEIYAGNAEHNNPVASWNFSNVVAKRDDKGNIYPKKENNEAKIDGVIAAIVAAGRYLAPEQDTESIYEQRGLRIV